MARIMQYDIVGASIGFVSIVAALTSLADAENTRTSRTANAVRDTHVKRLVQYPDVIYPSNGYAHAVPVQSSTLGFN